MPIFNIFLLFLFLAWNQQREARAIDVPFQRKRSFARNLQLDNVTVNTKLVLTPLDSELTDEVADYLGGIFDEASLGFIQLVQSLSIGGNERGVLEISSSVESQVVDSVYVLGAAEAFDNLAIGAGSRHLLRKNIGKHDPLIRVMRHLIEGPSSGVIVSSLGVNLASTIQIEDSSDSMLYPDVGAYIRDFLAPNSPASLALIDAINNFVDEQGRKPLAHVKYIGIDKSILWDNPYGYVDEQKQEGLPLQERSAGGMVAEHAGKINGERRSQWISIAVGGAVLALAAIVSGTFASQLVGRRHTGRAQEINGNNMEDPQGPDFDIHREQDNPSSSEIEEDKSGSDKESSDEIDIRQESSGHLDKNSVVPPRKPLIPPTTTRPFQITTPLKNQMDAPQLPPYSQVSLFSETSSVEISTGGSAGSSYRRCSISCGAAERMAIDRKGQESHKKKENYEDDPMMRNQDWSPPDVYMPRRIKDKSKRERTNSSSSCEKHSSRNDDDMYVILEHNVSL